MSERVEPSALDDVAAVMKANLPEGMTPKMFGQVMQWGRGNAPARRRMATLTADQLRLAPANPSAAGRADLMRYAAYLLRGSK